MPDYKIRVGRDARMFFDAVVPANSLAEAKEKVSRQGYDCPAGTSWTEVGVDLFDNVETVCISDPETDDVIAFYSEGDGWEDPS